MLRPGSTPGSQCLSSVTPGVALRGQSSGLCCGQASADPRLPDHPIPTPAAEHCLCPDPRARLHPLPTAGTPTPDPHPSAAIAHTVLSTGCAADGPSSQQPGFRRCLPAKCCWWWMWGRVCAAPSGACGSQECELLRVGQAHRDTGTRSCLCPGWALPRPGTQGA